MAVDTKGIFTQTSEQVLQRGLSAMTRACDALTARNSELEEELESLSNQLARSKEKLLVETSERE